MSKIISKIKDFTIISSIILFVLTGMWAYLHFCFELGVWQGKSYETFEKRACRSGHYQIELPEKAQDFRFRCCNFGIGAYSIEAFTLTDQAYDEFINSLAFVHTDKEIRYDELDLTGMKVSETVDYYNEYDEYMGFPKGKRFKKVIDDDIRDYTIIYYSSYGNAGSETFGIATNPETGRIVIYYGGSN